MHYCLWGRNGVCNWLLSLIILITNNHMFFIIWSLFGRLMWRLIDISGWNDLCWLEIKQLTSSIQKQLNFWSERSACAAPGCWHKRRWPLFLVIYSSSYHHNSNHRWGCRRVSNLYDMPLCQFSNGGMKKKKLITKNSGHLRLCQQPGAAHALCSDRKLPKIVATYIYASSQGQRMHSTRTKRKNIPKIVATFVYASSQGQRTHSARTKIPKIVATFVYASSQGQRTHSARTN